MTFRDKVLISRAEFIRRARLEQAGPQSIDAEPLAGLKSWEANTTARELIAEAVFPVWLLGPTGGDFDHWEYPEYRRILFRDALLRPDFIAECGKNRHSGSALVEPFGVLLVHCSNCGHFAVVDGNRRLTRLAQGTLAPGLDAKLRVSVLEGSKWKASTPDMNKICACFCR